MYKKTSIYENNSIFGLGNKRTISHLIVTYLYAKGFLTALLKGISYCAIHSRTNIKAINSGLKNLFAIVVMYKRDRNETTEKQNQY